MSDSLWRWGGGRATGILQTEHLQGQTKNGSRGELLDLDIKRAQRNAKGLHFGP